MYLCGGSPDFFLFSYSDYWSDPLQRSEFGIREFWDTLYSHVHLNYIFVLKNGKADFSGAKLQ
jgi:hypothetical protein